MGEAEEQNNKQPKDKVEGPTQSFDGSTPGPGSQIGPFRIEQELGRGGAGVVYLAHDTKLDRSVAIKSLSSGVKDNPKALSRFTREARVLASLNHPNIAMIHEVLGEAEGLIYLVLEYVPGQTLADRIAKKPLKLEEALTIALQIAEAVAAAHEHDVIHRDLKPGNIKITQEGKVKVLDFGLAKVVGGEDTDQKTTITEPGRVIGTPAYMSPEQARGQEADKRCDIWSFGCVLYEMLTGKVPFEGETISDTLAGILEHEPNWQVLPESTPTNIRVLLRRCLQKDPHRRLRHIGDASIEIDETLSSLTISGSIPVQFRGRLSIILVSGLAGLLVGFAILWAIVGSLKLLKSHARRDITYATLLPHSKIADEALFHHGLAISPDGRRVAYVDQGEDVEQIIYVRELDGLEDRAIPGTEGAINPFFSPDGTSLAYADNMRKTLEIVSIHGGAPRTLNKETSYFGGGAWLDDDTIVFSPDWETGLWTVSASGGPAEPLTTVDLENGEDRHLWPSMIPNNNILFESYWGREGVVQSRLEVYSIASGTRRLLLDNASFGRFVPSGHLLFIRNGTLFAARFDPDNLDLGKSVPLLQHVIHNPRQHATQLAFSSTGTLVYVPAPQRNRKLVWVDDRGRIEPLTAPPRAYNSVSLAPGDARIGLSIESKAFVQTDVWFYDIPRSMLTPLTFDGLSMMPQWLDNPQELAYLKYDPEAFMCDLLCLYVDGTKDKKLIARVPSFFERGYSIDESRTSIVGTVLVPPDDNQDLMVIDLDETDSMGIRIADDGWQRLPTISYDGQWLAYSSFETGTWEVYVKSFPELKAKKKISNAGGYEPLWGPHGNKLYYRNGDEIWIVTYQAGETFEPSPPQFLFERHFFGGLAAKQKTYSVAEDGRFLMIQENIAPGTQINVILNWFEELKRLVPTEKK